LSRSRRLGGRKVTYGFGELDELVLAYATTIHKAQSSEYPAVIIPLPTQHHAMLARNLLYTSVPRSKSKLALRRGCGAAAQRGGGGSGRARASDRCGGAAPPFGRGAAHRVLGQFDQPYARRASISGVLDAPVMLYWNIEKR
jgi:hypothetical protein